MKLESTVDGPVLKKKVSTVTVSDSSANDDGQ